MSSFIRISRFVSLGTVLALTALGQACEGCGEPPGQDAGPGTTLAFDGLPQTVNCDSDDADADTAGFQLEVTVLLVDDDGTGYTDVEVSNSRGDVAPGTGAFASGSAKVTIEVGSNTEPPGAENTLTATATNADGESITASETVRVICADVPPDAPTCRFVSPEDGDTLTSNPSPVSVECTGAAEGNADELALVTTGTVRVTGTPEGGGLAASLEIDLSLDPARAGFGIGSGDLILTATDAAIIDLVLLDPNNVLAPPRGPVVDAINVTVDVGITVTDILVVEAGDDDVLNVADNGNVATAGLVNSDVTVAFEADVTGKTIAGENTTGTCTGVGAGTNVTLAGCSFPQGASEIVVSAPDGTISAANNALTVTVDTVPPTANIVSPGAGEVLTSDDDVADPGFQANVVVATDAVEAAIFVDDSAATNFDVVAAGTITLATPIGEGAHALTARVIDGALNEATSAAVSVTVDSVPPALVLAAPATVDQGDDLDALTLGVQVDVTVTPTGLVAGSAIDIVSDVEGVINEGACTAAGAGVARTCRVTFISEGTHSVTATATDENGNVGVSNSVNVDATTGLVFVSVDSPALRNGVRAIGVAEDGTPGGDAQVNVTGSTAPNTDLQVFIDGVPANVVPVSSDAAGNYSIPVTLPEGSGSFEVRVVELLTQGSSGVDSYIVDLGRPTTSITNPAGATATFAQAQDTSAAPGLQVNVTVDVTECESGVIVVRDGGTVIGQSATLPAGGAGSFQVSVSDVTEGTGETWTAQCTDAVGNTAAAPDSISVDVDITGPATVAIAIDVTSIRAGQVTIAFSEPSDGGDDVTALSVVASRQTITLGNFDTLAVAPFSLGGGGLVSDVATGAGDARSFDVTLAFDNTWNFGVRGTDGVGNATLSLGTLPITDFDTTRSTVEHVEGDTGLGADIDDSFAGSATGSGDINGDGINDLVVLAPQQGDTCVSDATGTFCEGALHIFGGGGDLGAGATRLLQPPAGASNFGLSAAVLDLDGDGNSDIVTTAFADDVSEMRIYVYYGIDGPTFVSDAPTAILTTPPFTANSALAVGDVSDDGFDDFVLAGSFFTPGEPIFLVRGGATRLTSGSVASRATTTQIDFGADSGGATEFFPAAAGLRIDGDAFGDLVVATDSATDAVHQIWTIAGRDNAAWGATLDLGAEGTSMPCPGGSCGLGSYTTGDFNGDSNVDLAVPGAGTIAIHTGNGAVLSTAATIVLTATDNVLPFFGAGTIGFIGDVNGDGLDDVAAPRRPNQQGGVFSVYLGSTVAGTRSPDIDYSVALGPFESPTTPACGNFDGDADGFDELCFVSRPGTGIGGQVNMQR